MLLHACTIDYCTLQAGMKFACCCNSVNPPGHEPAVYLVVQQLDPLVSRVDTAFDGSKKPKTILPSLLIRP